MSAPLETPLPASEIEQRAAVLLISRRRFAAESYAAVSLRDLANEARVAPAVVLKQFRSKRGLFRAGLEESLEAERITRIPREGFGTAVVAQALARPLDHRMFDGLRAVLRSGSDEEAGPVVRELVKERLIRPITSWLEGDGAGARAEMIVTEMLALCIHRESVAPESDVPREDAAFAPRFAARLQELI